MRKVNAWTIKISGYDKLLTTFYNFRSVKTTVPYGGNEKIIITSYSIMLALVIIQI